MSDTLDDPLAPVLIDALALEAFETEVRDRHERAGTESGGLLVGPRGTRIVLDFIPSGAGAHRGHAVYRTDPEYLQRALDACFARHGGDVLGYGHSHPPAWPEPSPTDLREAARMLEDPDYAPTDEVLMPIAQVIEGVVSIRWFIYLAAGVAVEVEAIAVPHWEATAGLTRELEADGFLVEQRRLPDPGLVLVASRRRERFAIVLEPDFPRSTPRVFRLEGDDPVCEIDPPWNDPPVTPTPPPVPTAPRPVTPIVNERFRAEFTSRSAALVDPDGLRRARALVIGCGSVGSAMATQFVRAGLGGLTLVDPDVVSVANLARSEYEHADVGHAKVDALRARLHRIHPGVELYARRESLLDLDDDALRDLAVLHELIVVAVDVPDAIRAANAAFHRIRPVVYPGVYEMGRGGEVLFTRPELPCLECFLRETRFGAMAAPTVNRIDYGSADGRLVAEPALVAQIGHVVSVATLVGLSLLSKACAPSSEMARLVDPGFSAVFVSNQAGWIFDHPFQGVWARVERNPACTCAGADEEPTDD